jgi:hypothetical protein
MLINTPPQPRKRRPPVKPVESEPAPPAPAVVIAAVVPGGIGMVVTLQFDRPLVPIGPPPYPVDAVVCD